MLPGAMVGIFIGYLTAKMVSGDAVKLLVGLIGVWFVARHYMNERLKQGEAKQHNAAAGSFWGAVTGFTSFVAHSGGPPYQVYTLPLKPDPKVFAGTATIFFAVVNTVKLVPYFALGQFDTTNLAASAVLMPLAPLATMLGIWIVKRMSAEVFYPFMNLMLALVSVKLVWDGAMGIWG
jgi:uncharacterized membrane protein YfcA